MSTPTRARVTSTRSKAKSVSVPATETKQSAADLQDAIRARAYELWIERGCQDGFAQDDWLRAEAEITAQYQKRTA